MDKGERVSGIDVIGRVPWSTHFGLFYKSKQDLIDVLVPYFKAGLENNEFCMWVTAEPLGVDEARWHMSRAMPDFDVYVEKGQIEIISYTEWYMINGVFDADRVLNGWVDKLREAEGRGFSGLRLTGNESWLDRSTWGDFIDYEQRVDNVVGQYKMIIVCSYPQDKSDASDVLDVAGTHQFVLANRNGEWKLLEDQRHKKAREALKLTQFALDNFRDSAIWLTLEGSIIYVNDEACRSLGYSREELLSMHIWDIDPNYTEEKLRALLPGKRQGLYTKFESTHVARDGRAFPVEVTSSYTRYGDKEYLITFDRDITERKRIERELRLTQFSVEKASDQIFWMDSNGRVIYVNDATCNILGFSRAELLSMYVWDFDPTYSPEIWLNTFSDLKKKGFITFETKHTTRDGVVFPVEITANYVEYNGKAYSFAYVRDITMRKRAEKELYAEKQQAELYLDLMGHDINNLHQVALGYLELARDIPTGENQAVYLNKPVEVLQRSAMLISNVRKLQKIRDGTFQNHDVDVCKVLTDVQREFGAVPDKTITLSLNGFEHCHVRANELLHDVFSNLVGNAIKHTMDRASIVVDLDVVEDNGGRYCRVIVEDDGPGIPDRFKGVIFNRALKGTANAKGIGLGLYLVKSLVESYHGKVWVEDRVKGDHSKGSRFVVLLPAVEASNGY